MLQLLHVRGIEVPDAIRERILAEQNLDRLKRWFDKAVEAKSIRGVLRVRRASSAVAPGAAPHDDAAISAP